MVPSAHTSSAYFASAAAMRLAWWLSPAFPVGAYAYSHGLEWAAEAGDLGDERACAAWIGDVLADGAGRNDAILLRHACLAMAAGDEAGLADVNELALALAPSGELRLETAQQGRSFLDAVCGAWPEPRLIDLARALDDVAYPVAVGMAAAGHAVAPEAAVPLYLAGFAQTLVSAALRLAPIGQNAGLRILAGLEIRLAPLVRDVMTATLDDIGSSTFRADLGSFRHETQYTRLFRS